MFTQKAFEDALHGDDSELVRVAGPGGVVLVAAELGCALAGAEGAGQLWFGLRGEQGELEVRTLTLSAGFRVRDAVVEGGQVRLNGVDGRFVRTSPEELTTRFLAVELWPHRVRGVLCEGPEVDAALSERFLPEIGRTGEATVSLGERSIWVTIDQEEPDDVLAMVPHVREILASVERYGRAAAEFLLELMTAEDDEDDDSEDSEDSEEPDEDEPDEDSDEEEDEFDEADFFAKMVPTGLYVFSTRDFELHFEGASDGEYFLDNYWPSVQFTPDGTIVDYTIEA